MKNKMEEFMGLLLKLRALSEQEQKEALEKIRSDLEQLNNE